MQIDRKHAKKYQTFIIFEFIELLLHFPTNIVLEFLLN